MYVVVRGLYLGIAQVSMESRRVLRWVLPHRMFITCVPVRVSWFENHVSNELFSRILLAIRGKVRDFLLKPVVLGETWPRFGVYRHIYFVF